MATELLHAAHAVPANSKTAQMRHCAYMSSTTVDPRVSAKVTEYNSYRRDEAHKI